MAWWNPLSWGEDESSSVPKVDNSGEWKKSGPNSRPTFTKDGVQATVGSGQYLKALKAWQERQKARTSKKRKGDTVKGYANGGGVRPAENEYR